MLRRVYVGDVHATVDELPECRELVAAVRKFAAQEGAQQTVWLGDLFNTMSTVRVEVLAFWLDLLNEGDLVVPGNHDMSNDRTRHVLEVFEGGWEGRGPAVVDRGGFVYNGMLHLPYIHDPAEFVALCRKHANVPGVVCHNAFTVSAYEDAGGRYKGIYAGKEGVDPNQIPQKFVISGHVHKPGQYGKVWHPGAPRWRTEADANEERGIWCVDHADDGSIVGMKRFDTAAVCRRIVHVDDTPEHPANVSAGPMCDARVDIHGPGDYCRTRAAELSARGVRVATFRTDAVAPTVRESDGLEVAWGKFLGACRPARGTAPARIGELAEELYGLRGVEVAT